MTSRAASFEQPVDSEALGRASRGGHDRWNLLDQPEQVLTARQRRRLHRLGPVRSWLARNGFELNRRLVQWFLKLRVEGSEHLPQHGPFVIAANHVSHLDPPVLAAALDGARLEQTHWAASLRATRRNRLTRLGSRLAKTVPIDPQRGVVSSLAFGAAVLQRQKILVWFPEGQRSASGKLLPFRPGLGILLHRFPVPVIPACIHGTYQAMPRGSRLPRSYPTCVRFGAPLDPLQLERSGQGDQPPARIVDALQRVIAEMAKP